MAIFLKEGQLSEALYKLIESAKEDLLLISPYIKLHLKTMDALKVLKNKPEVKIVVLYGKNEDDKSKSLSKEDLSFLKQFPNIEIRYTQRLHAKIYANERKLILSSMNLHRASQNENIEIGLMFNNFMSVGVANKIPYQTYSYIDKVIEKSELFFRNQPKYSKGFLGSGIGKKYINSIADDNYPAKSLENANDGYCISCCKATPFSGKRKPFCIDCFSQTVTRTKKFKYCHSCGASDKSSWDMPVCDNCYSKGGDQIK